MDRRQQKTRAAIFEAFGTLLSAKGYSKITVQDIIDEANVGRTTFYAHFETKDDLLKEMCSDLFSHVFSDSLSAESTHDFSMKTGNPSAMITHILYHLLDNKRNIIGILTCESGELFSGFFRQYLNELMAVRLLGDGHLCSQHLPREFLVNHISSSFVGMVQWWIKNRLAQTPEELADYFMAVISPVIY
ncbi:TetR/AcrR family transcriptional regulator [Lacrimispora brassicae]